MDDKHYVQAFSAISLLENIVFIGGAALLSRQATGHWRRTYAHLAAAKAIYVIRLLAIELVVGRSTYSRGSLYDLPLLISFLWLGTAGIIAYRNRGEETKFTSVPASEPPAQS